MHEFKVACTPVESLKFFNGDCGTTHIDLYKTNVDIAMMNNANFDKVEELNLSEMGMAEFSCPSNFTSLEALHLDHNGIKAQGPENYIATLQL